MKIKGLTLKDGKAVFSRVRYHENDHGRGGEESAVAAVEGRGYLTGARRVGHSMASSTAGNLYSWVVGTWVVFELVPLKIADHSCSHIPCLVQMVQIKNWEVMDSST